MKKSENGRYLWVSAFFFGLSIFIQSYFIQREQFVALMLVLLLASLSFIACIRNINVSGNEKKIWLIALTLHLIPFLSNPPLSNDVYRFLWDGELWNMGINPYDFKPNELIWQSKFINNPYFENLYAGMGALSQENYSCYPVLNQVYFLISTKLTDDFYFNLFTLRLLMIGSLWIGFIYLDKLLHLAKCKPKQKWLYIMNPLLIIEVSQNLHFEGVMISFILLGLYYLATQKNVVGALNLTFAIQIKLIPFVLLPFILRWLGWG